MSRLCLIALLLFSASATCIWAQQEGRDYEGPGNWFVGIDVGTSLAMGENVEYDDFYKTELPSATLQLGRMITPRHGLRLTGGLSYQFGHASDVLTNLDDNEYSPFRFCCVTMTADWMINLTNCFRPYNTRDQFDLYMVIGGGALYRCYLDSKVLAWSNWYPVQTQNEWFWLAKAGLEGAWHINRKADFTVALDANLSDNAYNGVEGHGASVEAYIGFRLGVVWYFRNGRGRHRFANPAKEHSYWPR